MSIAKITKTGIEFREDYKRRLSLLPEEQRNKLTGMLSHHMQNPIQKGLFEAGLYTVRDAGLPDAEEVRLYWMRGSVSRMAARYTREDVDLIVITGDKEKTYKRMEEPRKYYGEKARKDLGLTRKGSIVNPIFLPSEEFENFKSDPVAVDMRYAEYTGASMERVSWIQGAIADILRGRNVLSDPEIDPVSLMEDIIKKYSFHKHEKIRRKREREVCHNICFTTGRLCGTDLKKILKPESITENDPKQVHRIIQMRDEFLIDLYADVRFERKDFIV